VARRGEWMDGSMDSVCRTLSISSADWGRRWPNVFNLISFFIIWFFSSSVARTHTHIPADSRRIRTSILNNAKMAGGCIQFCRLCHRYKHAILESHVCVCVKSQIFTLEASSSSISSGPPPTHPPTHHPFSPCGKGFFLEAEIAAAAHTGHANSEKSKHNRNYATLDRKCAHKDFPIRSQVEQVLSFLLLRLIKFHSFRRRRIRWEKRETKESLFQRRSTIPSCLI